MLEKHSNKPNNLRNYKEAVVAVKKQSNRNIYQEQGENLIWFKKKEKRRQKIWHLTLS